MGLKALLCLLLGCSSFVLLAQKKPVPPSAQTVPLAGNSWKVPNSPDSSEGITERGIENWSSADASYQAFFRVNTPGSLQLWLRGSAESGKGLIEVSIQNEKKTVEITEKTVEDVYVGEWHLLDTGYVNVLLSGVKKETDLFPTLEAIKVAGTAINGETSYVKNNEGNFFYWGRRGPSVHLGYQVPEELDVAYYYNEITVPEGEDVIGSYYMATGFTGGYFGIQVNSETERRVLFSIWSPYVTDDPKEIPEEEQVRLLKKGEGVFTGEFGNEGSGGQSFLRYPWKAGSTYKFLLKGEPVENNFTEYTAWFFSPEEGEWRLIASFARPKTSSWLKRFHSFLENFSPRQGIYERKVNFGNQWIVDKNGNWLEINKAKFTADNTARVGFRMDYAGGVSGGLFFLRNCGFFSDYTPIDSFFERPYTEQKPDVDLLALP